MCACLCSRNVQCTRTIVADLSEIPIVWPEILPYISTNQQTNEKVVSWQIFACAKKNRVTQISEENKTIYMKQRTNLSMCQKVCVDKVRIFS